MYSAARRRRLAAGRLGVLMMALEWMKEATPKEATLWAGER